MVDVIRERENGKTNNKKECWSNLLMIERNDKRYNIMNEKVIVLENKERECD